MTRPRRRSRADGVFWPYGLYQRADDGTLTTAQRNLLIQIRHATGEGLSNLAREYGISPQRVWQIVNGN